MSESLPPDERLPSVDDPGCLALLGCGSVVLFGIGAGSLALMLIAGNAGPFGIGAFYAGLVMAGGLLLLALFAGASVVDGVRHRPLTSILGGLGLMIGVGLFVLFVGQSVGSVLPEVDPLWTSAGAISAIVGAAWLSAAPDRRRPVLAFGALWLALIALVAARAIG